jgi:hypothetical protein
VSDDGNPPAPTQRGASLRGIAAHARHQRHHHNRIATEIRDEITAGVTERALIAVVAYLASQFPDMTSAELSSAMREAMAAAEERALQPR